MRYEHGTSPRKYNLDYTPQKKQRTRKKVQTPTKAKPQKAGINAYVYFAFGIIIFFAFLVSIRTSQIEERNVKIQAEKKQIEQLKNDNAQLNIDLQRALSLTNIEKQAKNKLGMQELKNSQIRYVKLDKQDYVEPVSVTRIDNKQESFFEKIIKFFRGHQE